MGYLEKKVQQVQFIKRFWEDPCGAPWVVYLELAKKPAGEAVIELLSFGMSDVFRGFVRPKGIRGFGHLPRRKPSRRRLPGIPEFGNLIGSTLPGAEEVKARGISCAEKNLWLIDGVIQRGLWYWLLADVISDFAYEWTSTIAKSAYCSRTWLGGAGIAEGGSDVIIDVPTQVAAFPILRSDIVAPWGGGTLIIPNNWIGGLTFGAHVKGFLEGPPPVYKIWIESSKNPGVPLDDSGWISPGEEQTETCGLVHAEGSGETLIPMAVTASGVGRTDKPCCYAWASPLS